MQLALVAVVVALMAVLLKGQRPEQAVLLVLGAGIGILALLLHRAGSLFGTVRDLLAQSGLSSEYVQILFKGLGICLVTQLASDACRDAGETSMAAKAELVGRISLLVIGLPLFQKVADMALQIMNG